MNHPKIIAGRHGLPPTSNIPWSAAGEVVQRREVLRYFTAMWIVAGTGLFLFLFRLWIPGAICLITAMPIFFLLQDVRRQLYAMLLNKPRTLQGLTQWTGHSLLHASTVRCPCSEKHDLIQPGNYFGETKRFSVVCKCGRGHFCQMGPFSNFRGVQYEK
jgi:hypothetical protein